ncbi:MAG: hypothetical protein WBC44_00625 [Planctomycetaceae bacterium]
MRRIAALSAQLAVTATLGLTGCCYYELRDSFDECCYNVRTDYMARRAWCRCGGNFDDHPHQKYFGHGFRDGYESVARGGDGCCPTMPPRDCWGWCFDGCEGQQRMNAWFDGWSAGTIAAEADGLVGNGRLVFRQPSCQSCCNASGSMPPMSYDGGTIMTLPPGEAHITSPPVHMPPPSAVPLGPTVLPPPSPPSTSPAIPADEAYESYDEGGVYYQ